MSNLFKFREFAGKLKEKILGKGNGSGEEVKEQESWLNSSLDMLWEVEENKVLVYYERLELEE